MLSHCFFYLPTQNMQRLRVWQFGKLALCFALSILNVFSNFAHADKADKNKPAIIDSERATINEQSQTRIFEGNVIISKGSLLIKAERIELNIDREGYQILRATGSNTKPASFRQKREGLDEAIEAESTTLIFDGKADSIVLNDQASIRRLAHGIVQDEVRGAQIKYLNQTEFYEVKGGPTSSLPNGRVRTILAPRDTTASNSITPPTSK
jgi:lipopolysaccharide export system protein LptA